MNNQYHISGKTTTLKRYANVNGTIEAIQRIVHENYPVMENLADLLQCRTDEDTFRNIWNYVRHNIRYQNDQKGREQLRTPQRTLTDKIGDCDDMSILISAILTNLGYRHELIVAAYKRQNAWQHIYPVAYSKDYNDRFVIDCVPEIPRFNYEAYPIINQIKIDMRLEELGIVDNDLSNEAIMEMTTPFSLNGLGYMDDEDEILTIQGLLGDVVLVDEDDDHDTVLSGSELKKNIMLRQLVEAKNTLQREVQFPTEVSQLNDNRKDLALVSNIIENFDDEDTRQEAIDDAISQGTLYRNFYKTIQVGMDDVVNGLSGDDGDDEYYLKVMEEQGLLDDMIEEGIDGLGAGRFAKLKSKIKSKVTNFKKQHPKLAKVGHALTKFSPTGFTVRRSLEAFLVANVGGIAEKIAIGYATEAQAKKMGYSKAEWMQFVEGRKKAEDKWHALGGEKSHFKNIIMKGRGGKKAGLRGYDGLGIAPAIISAAMKVFGFVVEFFKKLKLKKQEDAATKAAASSSMPGGSPGVKRAGAASFSEEPSIEEEGSDGGSQASDDGSGVTTETVTDENGNETTVYKDKDGNEIGKFKAMFLKNKKIIIIVSCVLVVGIIALIIWKVRQKSMSGLGSAGISRKQENYIKRQQLNNRSYAALVREEIRKDGKKYTSPNRRKYYKQVFQESFQRPLSQKQISAAQNFNDLRRTVREKAKQYGGGKEGWRKAWADVKKKR